MLSKYIFFADSIQTVKAHNRANVIYGNEDTDIFCLFRLG